MLNKAYYWFRDKTSNPEERGEASSGYWLNLVRKEALKLCSPCEGNILEVGCGEGLFLEQIAQNKNNLHIIGIDIKERTLLKANGRLLKKNLKNIKLFRSDIQRLCFKSACFDTVACINVLYNLPSDKVFYSGLDEIMRLVKSGGKIIFDIRNSRNPLLYLKYKLAKYYDETTKELFLRTHHLDEVLTYLEAHSFRLTETRYIGFPKNKFAPIIILEAQKIK